MIEIKGLNKVYRRGKSDVNALVDINLKIEEGDFLALAGPSGSGKTTFLNILGCLDTPTNGEVLIKGKDIAKMSPKEKTVYRRNEIGYIFQNFNLIPTLSVFENVEYPLLLTKLKKAERKKLVLEALDQVKLSHRTHHFPKELSGGELQRVSIARALVKKPTIILADEPTANLDFETGKQIIDLMKKLNTENNATFIFSSHDDQLLNNVKMIIKLRDGKMPV